MDTTYHKQTASRGYSLYTTMAQKIFSFLKQEIQSHGPIYEIDDDDIVRLANELAGELIMQGGTIEGKTNWS